MPSERQLFLDHLAQTSEFPLMLEIEKAKGVYMFGKNGEKYIDLISGIGVSSLGHRHKVVTKAVKKQLDRYLHLMVYGEFVQSPQVKLAKLLSDHLPENLNSTYLMNSGSEAIEGAMKLAKKVTGRMEIISAKNAYHGSSHGALSIGGSEEFKNAFRPLLPGIKQITFNNHTDLDKITEQTAAVIIETIQGEGGVIVPDLAYMQALREKCTKTGALLVLDEIQVGVGRTGKLWAFEHFGIVPDILTLAKGLGGGMPIGAFISSKKNMNLFTNNPILGHISTFGGHPVSAAAAYATLKHITEKKLYKRAEKLEALFKKNLIHPKIKSIRSKGLMMAVEFDSFETLKPIIDKAIALGTLTDWFLYNDKSMRIAPPLIITKKEVEKSCKIIMKAIGK
ncbi:aspartate aminotransferase family protein [Flexithrix dorotheae]|uniref:aspartate aminotransferase family protein n=1 Tax=Flexithrix dorotheae TaxID=70993 RepID=UPI000368AFE8|nr:aspartate aminotransferase family protein [Flexithrix dorotheae]